VNRRTDLLFVLFFVSGFSGLIYESVWAHYVKLFLGHAAYAQTLVLVVFIGGLAIGAALCARVAERIRNPLRMYAWIEAATGVLALVFHVLFVAATEWGYAVVLPATCEQVSTFCASQWLLAAVLLLPQSVLLGMTFPLMSSAVLRLDPSRPGHHIAALYFFNSFGAMLGVLASGFLLIPSLGLPGTLKVAGAANLAIALAAYVASRSAPASFTSQAAPGEPESPGVPGQFVRLLLATSFLTGLSSFIYEIVWIRMLSLVLGASTQSFELMLAAFILGLAAGGLWIRNRIDGIADPVRYLAFVQIAMGLAAAATIVLYNGTFDFMAWLLSSIARTNGGYVLFNMASTAIALAMMLPATFCAGMTLPLITYRLLRSSTGERALGSVYAVNTLGSIIGVVLAVHLLLEWLGLRGALLMGAALDLLLGVALLLYSRSRTAPAFPWGAVAGVVAFALMAATFTIDPRRSSSGVFRTGHARISSGEQIAFHRDGKTASVDVIDFNHVRSIRTNGKADAALSMSTLRGPTSDEYTMALLAVLPMGHQPRAQTAAVIGFGSGMTTATLLASPMLTRVDTIEIEPAMVEGAKLFGAHVGSAFSDPRSRIVIDDAKSYFARGSNRYDIIVSEPSNPWVSGVSSLFTEEFYARLSKYMNDGGVLCQWLHTYEMDAATLASIFAALSKTFPDFVIYSTIDSDIVVVARKNGAPGLFNASVLAYPKLHPVLERLRLDEAEVVQRRLVASWGGMRPWFESLRSPPNSDFRPVVDHWASKTRFTQTRVSELVALQDSAIPLLELLAGAPVPASRRHDASGTTFVETSTRVAWELHDVFFAAQAAAPGVMLDTRYLAARTVREWTIQCPADLSFEAALPAMVSLAEDVNPRVDPENAARLWKTVAASACAKKLDAAQRRWLELFEATARRDAQGMARGGLQILDESRGRRNASSEYAFFSAVTGVAILGDLRLALVLLQKGSDYWIRPGTRTVEREFLEATISAAALRSPSR
jgi:spermidine synthase